MKNRGPAPEDHDLFAPDHHGALRTAVSELSWLLDRDYSLTSALELVGNRHSLTSRQRQAVSRASCTEIARRARQEKRIDAAALDGRALHIDGFNVLITSESLQSGAPVFAGRDGALRDIASVYGSWRMTRSTETALDRIAGIIGGATSITWWLDRPVGNSGRFRQLLLDLAARNGWSWSVELADDPDKVLCAIEGVVASADARILDACSAWIDLPRTIAPEDAWLIDLS